MVSHLNFGAPIVKRLLPLLCLGFIQVSHAQEAQESSGGYMGFAIGSFDYEETYEGLTFADTTSAYRLLAGYRFNDSFALEGGWGTTSDIEDSYTQGNLTLNVQADYEILTLRALGMIPLSKASLFGGVGYYDADLTASATLTGVGQFDLEGSSDGATLVGGVQFEFERVSIRGEYEWFDTDDGIEAWDISLGLLFKF